MANSDWGTGVTTGTDGPGVGVGVGEAVGVAVGVGVGDGWVGVGDGWGGVGVGDGSAGDSALASATTWDVGVGFGSAVTSTTARQAREASVRAERARARRGDNLVFFIAFSFYQRRVTLSG
jgi:hypothetical protein